MERDFIAIVDEVIDPAAALRFLDDPGHGAQVSFFGVVRNLNLGQRVLAVSYDVFEPLAVKTFREITANARAQFGEGLKCFLVHRRGRVAVGEISVAILVSSAHRDEAYRASRFVIEEVKHRAPVWKKEHYEGGDSEWVEGHSLCGHR